MLRYRFELLLSSRRFYSSVPCTCSLTAQFVVTQFNWLIADTEKANNDCVVVRNEIRFSLCTRTVRVEELSWRF